MFSFELEPHERVQIDGAILIASAQTQYQRIEIVKIPGLGETLFLDGFPQVSAADSFIFNEVMIHPPMCASELGANIFVAGVGSGFGVAQIIKHSCVERVYALDVDREAVNFYREHLSFWEPSVVSDPRVTLVFADGRHFLQENIPDGSLDVIVIDLPDPHPASPSRHLFTQEFYRTCRRKLKQNGIFLTQAGRFRLGAMDYHQSVRSTCCTAFDDIKTYHFYCPCYYEPWSFLMCANTGVRFPAAGEIDAILSARGVHELRYYSGAMDRALSEIPLLLKAATEEPVTAFAD